MRPIPLPVRVAAGLVATALEQARKFPVQLVELPVTAASRAVQAGMRVQQRVTELAIKGDEVFSIFRQVEDTPPWARFDEDDEAHETPHRDEPYDRDIHRGDIYRGDIHSGDIYRGEPQRDEPQRLSCAGSRATTTNGATPGSRTCEDDADLAAVVPGPGLRSCGEIDESDVAHALTPEQPSPAPPSALPGYDKLSLPQLRGKLRGLSLAELEALLEHEHAHQDRAPFVTMLSNRITTVRSR